MKWNQVTVTYKELSEAAHKSAAEYLQFFKDKGIPISPDYLVMQERTTNGDFIYKWRLKTL